MKKLLTTLCLLVLSFSIITTPNHAKAIADEITQLNPTINTYYPEECSQYVDLNNVEAFAVGDNYVYYAKHTHSDGLVKFYSIHRQSLTSSTSEVIVGKNDFLRNLIGINYVNGYLFIKYDFTSYLLYNTNSLNEINDQSNSIILTTLNNNTIKLYHDGENYISASIKSNNSTLNYELQVCAYSDLEDITSIVYEHTYDLSTISDIDNTSTITLGKNKVYVLDSETNTLYPFNYDNTQITVSEPKTKPLFSDIQSTSIYSNDEKSCFVYSNDDAIYFFSPETNEEEVKQFDGSGYDNNCIYVLDNSLYFYNTTTCDLKAYEIDTTQEYPISNENVVLMGKGNSVGRFDNVNDIVLKSNDYIFVSDKNNSRIQILKNEQETQIINLKESSTPYYAKALMLSKDNTLYYIKTDGISSTLCGINIFKNTSIDPISISGHISDACIFDDGMIYLLDYNETKIITINTENNYTLGELNLNGVVLNNNSKIDYIDRYLIISIDNKLYRYSTIHNTLLPDTIDFTNNITSFSYLIDQTIYVACENENKVYKVCFEDNMIPDNVDTEIEWNADQNVDIITTNPQDGSIYGYDKNTSSIVYFTEQNFANGFDTLEPFQKYVLTSLNGYTNVVKYAVLKADNFVYEFINYKGNHDLYTEDKNVIVLDTNINTTQFTYILYISEGEVKLGYAETSALEIHTITPENNKFSLITTDTNSPIYKFPTIKGNLEIENVENIGTVLNADGIYPISIDDIDTEYYIIRLINNTYGFIPSSYVTQNVNISEKFSTNASIEILDYSDFVNVYSDNEKNDIIGALSDGQRIYVEKFDKNSELTLIKYIDENNKIRAGYIVSKYISMDGISPLIITSIILFSITLVIIIALVVWYIIFKKKHNQDTMKEKDQIDPNVTEHKTKKQNKIEDIMDEDDNIENNDSK